MKNKLLLLSLSLLLVGCQKPIPSESINNLESISENVSESSSTSTVEITSIEVSNYEKNLKYFIKKQYLNINIHLF